MTHHYNLNDLSLDEANTILEALGHMPFIRVVALIDKLQRQMKAQYEIGRRLQLVEGGSAPEHAE